MRIALVGNPNSGKTTMYNTLTGSTQYVGNWPGVTVEKKEGALKGHKDVTIIDLPGIYSLSPYTLEEVVARNYILDEHPDAIINIVDATNIERNLYLTTQLMEIGVPVVVALNMMDVVRKNNDIINAKSLAIQLGCHVVETSALTGEGTTEIANQALAAANEKKTPSTLPFSAEIEAAIEKVSGLIADTLPNNTRYYAIKLFERDSKIQEKLNLPKTLTDAIESITQETETAMDDDSESLITSARYDVIGGIVSKAVKKAQIGGLTTSDKIDRVMTNRILALPIFAIIMFLVYFIAMSGPGLMVTDWVNEVLFGEIIPGFFERLLESVGAADWLQGLILDGIIAGVGAVLGFVPQIIILFFLLSILEDCGYMARVAFIMDRIFRKFGLSGKSFIPMLISTGCGVPGVMATRTIENEKDRRLTIMMTTFIPCSAKMPIFALFAGALFGGSALVAFSMYFIGLAVIILCGILLKRTKRFGGDPAPFVMELPAYHMPSAVGVLKHTWDRGSSFIVRAGTIILLSTIVVWFTGSFGWNFRMVEDVENSILASIGRVVAPIFIPLGWGNWQSTVATVSGLIAKENVVGTFGVIFGLAEATEETAELWGYIGSMFTVVSAYSFMIFNLLCCPCFAAVGAIKRELGKWKDTLITIGFQCGVAYVVALLVNVIGGLFL